MTGEDFFAGAEGFFAAVGLGGADFLAAAAFVAGADFFDALGFAGAEALLGRAFFAGAFTAGAFLALAICGEPPSTQVSLRCYRRRASMWTMRTAKVRR